MKRRKTAQYYPNIHIQCSNNTKIWNTPLHFIPFFCLTDRCLKRTRSIWRYYTSFYSVLQYLRSEKKLFPKNCRIFFIFDCEKDTIICSVYSWYTFTRKSKPWSFDMLRNFFWKSVFSVLRLFSGKELSITFTFIFPPVFCLRIYAYPVRFFCPRIRSHVNRNHRFTGGSDYFLFG